MLLEIVNYHIIIRRHRFGQAYRFHRSISTYSSGSPALAPSAGRRRSIGSKLALDRQDGIETAGETTLESGLRFLLEHLEVIAALIAPAQLAVSRRFQGVGKTRCVTAGVS